MSDHATNSALAHIPYIQYPIWILDIWYRDIVRGSGVGSTRPKYILYILLKVLLT